MPGHLFDADLLRSLCAARDELRSGRGRPLRAVAAAAGLSPFHFIRCYRGLFGETPHQHRVAALISRAQLLLASTDLPVTEVCLELGFSSLGTFTTSFTRRVGIPPGAYRRAARARPPAPPHDCFAQMA